MIPSPSASVKKARANGEELVRLSDVRPVDLLAQRTRDLEDRAVVRLLLRDREELRHEHVVDRGDENRQRADFDLGRAREVRVVDLSAGGPEDQVDEVALVVPGLVQPVLGRALAAEAVLHERLERADPRRAGGRRDRRRDRSVARRAPRWRARRRA